MQNQIIRAKKLIRANWYWITQIDNHQLINIAINKNIIINSNILQLFKPFGKYLIQTVIHDLLKSCIMLYAKFLEK